MRSYKLNKEHAVEGDSTSSRIEESGQYIGVFTEAKEVKSEKGTEGVELKFKSNTGLEASYMTLWTYNAQGEAIWGLKQLNALMMCASVRELNPISAQGKIYDGSQMVDAEITIFPELMNKPIGVVLQKELYTKNNGDDSSRMNLFAFFNHESKKTASEIADKKDATALTSMLKTLADRDNRKPSHGNNNGQAGGAAPASDSNADEEWDDDVPF